MLESFLVAGRQNPGDPATLTYGQSVTDACMDIEMTASALENARRVGAGPRAAPQLSDPERGRAFSAPSARLRPAVSLRSGGPWRTRAGSGPAAS